jgi:hypothetical protein
MIYIKTSDKISSKGIEIFSIHVFDVLYFSILNERVEAKFRYLLDNLRMNFRVELSLQLSVRFNNSFIEPVCFFIFCGVDLGDCLSLNVWKGLNKVV